MYFLPLTVTKTCAMLSTYGPLAPVSTKQWEADLRQRNRQYIWDYKASHPCSDCGESDPRVLDLDHDNPDNKSYAVSKMVSRKLSLNKIQEEIAKCTVRCANCHRKRTVEQFGHYDWAVGTTGKALGLQPSK